MGSYGEFRVLCGLRVVTVIRLVAPARPRPDYRSRGPSRLTTLHKSGPLHQTNTPVSNFFHSALATRRYEWLSDDDCYDPSCLSTDC
jgi:hypothetical protein